MSRPKVGPGSAKERAQRAAEWLELRKTYLLTQVRLAELSGVSRRSIQMIEAGLVVPEFATLRRFLDLKQRLADEKVKAA